MTARPCSNYTLVRKLGKMPSFITDRVKYHSMFSNTIARLAALKPISWVLSRILFRLDARLLRMTDGKFSLTSTLTEYETVILTTTGAKSGAARSVPLMVFWDGEKAILIASYYGGKRHPGWHYNLMANPQATIIRAGSERSYLAHLVEGNERGRYWALAASQYPGYESYKSRAGEREIGVWVLEPVE